MREKTIGNIKSKNTYTKSRLCEDSSNNNYYYSFSYINTKISNNNINGIKEIISCIKDCFLSFQSTIVKMISKLSFLFQSILFKIPILILGIVLLAITHIYLFELLYFDNYFYVIRVEKLNKLIDIIDSKYFELKNIELQKNLEEAEELLFFNIYFKELIDMGIMEEKNGSKGIFPPVNNNSGSIYSGVNSINKNIGINNDYTIYFAGETNGFNKSESSNLCELAKIY